MGNQIECPLCRKIHKDWRSYAEHLLANHTEDEDRCQWAKDITELLKDGNKPSEPVKVESKPVELTSPTKKLPKYLRKQLEE